MAKAFFHPDGPGPLRLDRALSHAQGRRVLDGIERTPLSVTLPPDVREAIVQALADALVADFRVRQYRRTRRSRWNVPARETTRL